MTAVRGLSPADYGLVTAIYYGATVVAEVPSGVVADRIGRRNALTLGALANASGCAAFALAGGLWGFALGELAFALGTSLMSGADSALLYDSLSAEGREAEYPQAEGRGQAAWLLTAALGFPLADWLLVRGDDPVLAVWVTAGMSLLGVGFSLAMIEPARLHSASGADITRGAIRDVIRSPGVLRLIVYSIGIFVLLRAAVVVFFNPVLGAADVPLRVWGSVLAVVNLLGGVAAWQSPALLARLGARNAMIAMAATLAAMFAGMIVVRAPPVAALFVLQGVILGVHPTVVRTGINQRVGSAERRATILSIESLACRAAFGVVVAFAGFALDRVGLEGALAGTLAVGFVPIAIAALWRPRPDPASRGGGSG